MIWCLCSSSEGAADDASSVSEEDKTPPVPKEVEEARTALSDFCKNCPPSTDLQALQVVWDRHLEASSKWGMATDKEYWKGTAELCCWLAILWSNNPQLISQLCVLLRSAFFWMVKVLRMVSPMIQLFNIAENAPKAFE